MFLSYRKIIDVDWILIKAYSIVLYNTEKYIWMIWNFSLILLTYNILPILFSWM